MLLATGLMVGASAPAPAETLSAVVALDTPQPSAVAAEFELRVGGAPAEIEAVEALAPAPKGRPWRVWVYFDTPLTTPEGLSAAVRLLGESAELLTALGPVTLLAADPEPRALLTASRRPHELRERLELFADRTTLAGELLWRRLRFLGEAVRDESKARMEMERERSLIDRQRSALLTSLSEDPGDGPGLLILVQDGFDLDFKRFYLGRTERLEGLDTDVDEAHATLCRAVAAAGWTVLSLSLGERGSEFANPRQPLRLLAEDTAGAVLLDGADFARALRALDRRVRLTYRLASPPPEPRPLEVRFRTRPVAAPRWAGPAAAPDAVSSRAAADVSSAVISLLSPGPGPHAGQVRVTAVTGDHEVGYVAFFLDGFLVDVARRPPFQSRLDLGAGTHPRTVRVAAFSPEALKLGEHSVRLNEEERPFRVEIVEVLGDPGRGEVDLRTELSIPPGHALERLELYWNDQLRRRLVEPLEGSITARIATEPPAPGDHYRVVAYLDDGTSRESARLAVEAGAGDRVDVNLVELYAMVTDRRQAPLVDLKREDFTLFHAGRSRPIEGFGRARDVPLTLGLAVDTSRSMAVWEDDMRAAAAVFFESALAENDRAFLTDFDERARLTQGPTRRRELLVGRMGALDFGGTTSLYDAILFSLAQFEDQGGRKALVVLTDGNDYGSRFRPERCIREALRLGVPIYMVVLERALDPLGDVERMIAQRLARRTGGQVHFFSTRDELREIYAAIEADLRSQYLLTYALERPLTAADLGEIRVEVRDPSLSVRTILGRSVH